MIYLNIYHRDIGLSKWYRLEIRQVHEVLENIQNDNFSVLYKRTTLFVRAPSNKVAVYKFEHLFFCYFNKLRDENFMTIVNFTTF